ncbi:ATP-binding protein [Neobacillus rhizophilus]|uniref:histidine kinase n=1 Tax=Neobacillus rhizophilus TaxID=2833579 RepID=A0A942U589_9BACI|nr:ATP-binding protein [Neobacillus rhizophilus]MBS4211759.1 HAMP domain-containing protein [Neobacillus rhizophilus]MBU8919509.1 HAMP domain-containing protein [Bacillus sp. FJAT-29953]
MSRIRNTFINSIPIRNKVLVFGLIMSSVPLLLISFYYYSFIKADLEERIIDKQKLILENLSNQIEMEFDQTIQRIQVFSSFKNLQMEKDTLYELLVKNDSIEEVVVTDKNGTVEKRVSRYKLNRPEKNENWFTKDMWSAFQKKEKIYGGVEFNQFDQPVIKLAVPFYDNGERKGIGVVVQLQKIIGQISSLRPNDSAYLYLVDRNGKVIAHQDYRKLWAKQEPVNPKEVLGVKTKINELDWTLVMEQPKDTAYQPIYHMMKSGFWAAALVTLIVSFISVYAGFYFTKPIIILENAMRKLTIGSKNKPVEITRKDELGQLTASFNEMSKELEDKTIRLAQEKERLDVVVSGIGAGLALITNEYAVTWMNPILKQWLKDDQVSLPCYRLIGEKNLPCENCPLPCPEKETAVDKVMNLKFDAGTDRIFRRRVFPLNHAIAGEGEFLIVIEDITEQKHMEEKIIQTDKLAALGLMASSFAHEVNNPLTTINVYAEDLMDRIQDDEQIVHEEVFLYLKKIKENTERCKRITGNLLNFSRKSNWTLSRIDLSETIQNSISLVEYSLRKNHIKLEVEMGENLPNIAGDSIKLMQVLVNLINNSVDAMPDGGIIKIGAKTDNMNLVLIVSDNGSGISKGILPKIFDPFYTTKPVGKGTGLGLSVCYGIIQQFGGTIEIDSELGMGTTIEIHIPVGREEKRWLQQSS